MITLQGIFDHPLKGGKENRMRTAGVEVEGLEHDRLFVAVESATGMFVAQRNAPKEGLGIAIPEICMVELSTGGYGKLRAPDMPVLERMLRGVDPRPVQIWGWKGVGLDCGEKAAQWMTEYLSRLRPGNYRLLRMPRNPAYQRSAKLGTARQRFTDAFPIHALSLASIDDLNARRAAAGKPPVPADRFRANFLFDGCEPYQEDRIRKFRVCGIGFVWTKGCDRCIGININQANGFYDPDGPLGDLAAYRRRDDHKIYFGTNFNHCGTGMLHVGDEVEVLEWAPA